jgi:hypothetical protein
LLDLLLDIVGLYLNPPENALVLCLDGKPTIQALDRTQPLLPLRAKKIRSCTNEYVRHGTQTLLAALEIGTGKIVAHVFEFRHHDRANQFGDLAQRPLLRLDGICHREYSQPGSRASLAIRSEPFRSSNGSSMFVYSAC